MAASPKIIVMPNSEEVPAAPEPYVLKEPLAVRLSLMYRPQLVAALNARQGQLNLLDLFFGCRTLVIAAIKDGATHREMHRWFSAEFVPVLPYSYGHFSRVLTMFRRMVGLHRPRETMANLAAQTHHIAPLEGNAVPGQAATFCAPSPCPGYTRVQISSPAATPSPTPQPSIKPFVPAPRASSDKAPAAQNPPSDPLPAHVPPPTAVPEPGHGGAEHRPASNSSTNPGTPTPSLPQPAVLATVGPSVPPAIPAGSPSAPPATAALPSSNQPTSHMTLPERQQARMRQRERAIEEEYEEECLRKAGKLPPPR